jgi:hypothetical protein
MDGCFPVMWLLCSVAQRHDACFSSRDAHPERPVPRIVRAADRTGPPAATLAAGVSTADQNPDHQIDALQRADVAREDIYVDHASGAKASRPELDNVLRLPRDGDTLKITRLRDGDTLKITRLDRRAPLGRARAHQSRQRAGAARRV